ncbi:putative extracellular heme-binding protein [Pseudomonas aeruginosa]|nr:putative extracellular heme-binding protein [Pseudomonas aeruginosa]
MFADLSATYYLKTETCDAAFAARLRAGANRYQRTENTPNCTPGSFMGSYTNTQNPPRLATNLTAGLRFFDQALTLGGRMTYTSGPPPRRTSLAGPAPPHRRSSTARCSCSTCSSSTSCSSTPN